MKNLNASTDRVQFNQFNDYVMDRVTQLFSMAFPNPVFDNPAESNLDEDGTICISGRIRQDENTVFVFNLREYINPVDDFIQVKKLVHNHPVRNDKNELSCIESKDISPEAVKKIVDRLKEF